MQKCAYPKKSASANFSKYFVFHISIKCLLAQETVLRDQIFPLVDRLALALN